MTRLIPDRETLTVEFKSDLTGFPTRSWPCRDRAEPRSA
jgi:hypothetical protein